MASFEKREKGHYRVKIRRRGYPTQTATFETKAQAQRWAREIENKMDSRNFVAITKEAERTTLCEALERYQREKTSKKAYPGAEGSKIGILKKHKLAARMLVAIRSADVAALRDEMEEDGKAANTIRLHLCVISHLFNVARREWGFEAIANPCELVQKPSTVGTERNRRLHEGELELLQEHAEPWLWPLIELAVETAMRRSELTLVTWEQIDLKACTIHLPKTKNGEARDVPLSPRAQEILRTLYQLAAGEPEGTTALRKVKPKGRLFDRHPDNVSHAFYDATVAAGIDDLRLHDLRHEATSRLFEKGLNIMEVARITGHRNLQVLKRYTHPRVKDLVKKLAAA